MTARGPHLNLGCALFRALRECAGREQDYEKNEKGYFHV
jgi:hypothetical protein